jgi:hypothetical protein
MKPEEARLNFMDTISGYTFYYPVRVAIVRVSLIALV